jgi:hypothetical protein
MMPIGSPAISRSVLWLGAFAGLLFAVTLPARSGQPDGPGPKAGIHAGEDGDRTRPAATVWMGLRVVDRFGHPLRALVVVRDEEARQRVRVGWTDSFGYVRFAGLSRDRDYRVLVNRRGYMGRSFSLFDSWLDSPDPKPLVLTRPWTLTEEFYFEFGFELPGGR